MAGPSRTWMDTALSFRTRRGSKVEVICPMGEIDGVEVVLSDVTSAHVVKNLFPFYLYDLSVVANWGPRVPTEHGLFQPDHSARTAGEYSDAILNDWWSEPETLLPHLIKLDEMPIGFALVACPGLEADADFILCEYFVVRRARRKGIGRMAAKVLFDRLAGRWQLDVMQENGPALAFWRAMLTDYTGTQPEEHAEEEDIVFRFGSGLGAQT